jgi:uncharacterized protein YggT (Ycf19 family)
MANKKDEEIVIPGFLKVSKIVVWVMYFWVTIGIISLLFRVFLLATSANTAAGFGNFVMNVSADYLQPFRGLFPPKDVGTTGYLDVSAIFAIIVYLFVAWGFKTLIDYIQSKIDLEIATQKSQIAKAERAKALEMQAKKAPVTIPKKVS